MAQEINDLYMDVYKLKADMNQLHHLIERLDTTIEKLTEVSTSISQLLAVQTNRLETVEKLSNEFSREITDQEKTFHDEMYKLEKDIYKEVENSHLDILEEIKSIREENEKQHDIFWKKLASMEKWIWVVSGGAMVTGFLIEKFILKII